MLPIWLEMRRAAYRSCRKLKWHYDTTELLHCLNEQTSHLKKLYLSLLDLLLCACKKVGTSIRYWLLWDTHNFKVTTFTLGIMWQLLTRWLSPFPSSTSLDFRPASNPLPSSAFLTSSSASLTILIMLSSTANDNSGFLEWSSKLGKKYIKT